MNDGLPLLLNSEPEIPVVVEAIMRPGVYSRLGRAVILGPWKLIVDQRNGGRMLFNLQTDPSEHTNLYRALPAVAQQMETAYQNWLDRADIGWEEGCTHGVDSDGKVKTVF